ncbi:MAG: DUF177 domain-containing protein [Prolixibacteraceae bacterium]|nr:DUF177 domain-containing protein [Prolixibacteraceae bacterium]
MNYLSKYEIAFKGLKEGTHLFEFNIDDKFFDKFENSEVKKGTLKADVTLTKQSSLMILDFAVKGHVELICDRCLDNYNQKIKANNKLFVKFGHEEEEMSDDVIVITYEEHQINIAQYLYEIIILGLPIKRIHPEKKGKSECNPEMVEKLKEYLVEDVSEEEPVDGRWKELKKLLDNK